MPAASSLAGEQAESNVVEEGRMAEEHHGGVAPALADYDAAADYNGGGGRLGAETMLCKGLHKLGNDMQWQESLI